MPVISSKTSKRVCKHMNKDHIDSVHKYLKHYGKISEFKEAYLEEISSQYMKINYDGKTSIINFKATSRLSMLTFEECKLITDYYQKNL